MVVYKLTNVVNGKVYVGKTVNSAQRRWQQHVRTALAKRGHVLGAAIRKHGMGSFNLEEIACAESLDHLNTLEKHFIQQYQSEKVEFGYNRTPGGDGRGNFKHSLETRRKIAAGRQGENHPMYGRKQSYEAKRKISEHNGLGFLGKNHTLVSRQKMGARGKDHPNFGKHLSEITRQKIQSCNSKTFLLLSPAGCAVITNLKKFCREHSLNAPHMNSVFHGKRNSHKGWTRC